MTINHYVRLTYNRVIHGNWPNDAFLPPIIRSENASPQIASILSGQFGCDRAFPTGCFPTASAATMKTIKVVANSCIFPNCKHVWSQTNWSAPRLYNMFLNRVRGTRLIGNESPHIDRYSIINRLLVVMKVDFKLISLIRDSTICVLLYFHKMQILLNIDYIKKQSTVSQFCLLMPIRGSSLMPVTVPLMLQSNSHSMLHEYKLLGNS